MHRRKKLDENYSDDNCLCIFMVKLFT